MEDDQIFHKELVFLNYSAADKNDFFDKASVDLSTRGFITDRQVFVQQLWLRENEFSTAVGESLAIPHCLTSVINTSFVTYFRLQEPIAWKSAVSEESQVKHIFMIGVNNQRSETHLRILSMLARNLMHKDFKDKIFNSETVEEVYQTLAGIQFTEESK